MRILIATPLYPPEIGGPATYVKELCEKLHKKHDLTVVAYTDSRETFPGTRLVAISKQEVVWKRIIKYTLAIWKEIKNNDIMYVQNAVAAGLPVAIVSLLSNKPFMLKFVGDEAWERATQNRLTKKRLEEFLESPEGNWKTYLFISIQKFVLRRANIVTTPSVYLGAVIQKAYQIKPEKVRVNYNAAEETIILPFETKRNPHQLLTTARMVAWKGIDGIIEAVSILKKKIPNIKLVIAGDGPEAEKLKKLSLKLHTSENVTFVGKKSRAETWYLRNASAIYVLNSYYEGLPHTILTNFAAGIPTIATNIAGTNEVIYHQQTGILVEPGNPQDLANSIETLMNNYDLQNLIVENGYKLLKEKFSWKSHIDTLNILFESILLKPIDK